MKISKYWYKENSHTTDNEGNEYNLNCWAGSAISEQDAQEKAYAKMQNWIARLAKGQALGDYEYQTGEIREQLIEAIYNDNQQLIAAITRNRYGALILNTDAVVIADVDIKRKTVGEFFMRLFGKKIDKRSQCLANIQACHTNYATLNFIIYQTYAGFRVIITDYYHSPNPTQTTALFKDLGADELYAKLCRVQACFRARLTPKPWRCQSPVPPHRFPRLTIEQQTAFANWQCAYEIHSQHYAVCYKLMQLGQQAIDSEIANIIALHDSYVLKPKVVPLA
jgi:hypothetical protein